MNVDIPDLSPSDLSRFWTKVRISNNCWLWTASKTSGGYGVFSIGKKTFLSHRISYFIKNGDIDPNLTIDHLCKNTICVNPNHLAEVTMKENIRRGETGRNNPQSKRICCPRGHPYDSMNNEGHRFCSICEKIRCQLKYLNKK